MEHILILARFHKQADSRAGDMESALACSMTGLFSSQVVKVKEEHVKGNTAMANESKDDHLVKKGVEAVELSTILWVPGQGKPWLKCGHPHHFAKGCRNPSDMSAASKGR
ncbi:hypothetical protein NDU88_006316 [Pleurodeles waltl]|uniref:Uncharacterized protein n=1 Tax=Pleurodeles waltl TaxID=8319 RepID=A0AAV7QNS9_PLEWA|nr:hypothetical protein NDU88_006316 [Pleurodeles waltl]